MHVTVLAIVLALVAGCTQTSQSKSIEGGTVNATDPSTSSSAIAAAATAAAAASAQAFASAMGDVDTAANEKPSSLQSVSYSNSGNSLGNVYRVTAEPAGNGGIVVTVEESPVHSDPRTVHTYRAPDDLLDRISAIVDACGMKTWGELPLSEFIALDGPTRSLSLMFSAADAEDFFPEWVSVSLNYELPEGGLDAFNQICDLMEECISDENLIG